MSYSYYAPATAVGKGAVSFAFVRPSVCPSVAYLANNSSTRRPSVNSEWMFPPLTRVAYQFQGQKVKGQSHQAH